MIAGHFVLGSPCSRPITGCNSPPGHRTAPLTRRAIPTTGRHRRERERKGGTPRTGRSLSSARRSARYSAAEKPPDRPVGGRLEQPHQLRRFGERQRAEEQGVHEPEHRRVQADATGQRQHRNPGEQRIAAQRPGGVAQVLPGAGQRPLARDAGRGGGCQRDWASAPSRGASRLARSSSASVSAVAVSSSAPSDISALRRSSRCWDSSSKDRRLCARARGEGGEARPVLGLPVTHDRPR